MVEVVLPEPVQMYKDVAIITHSHNVGSKAHNKGIFLVYSNMHSYVISIHKHSFTNGRRTIYGDLTENSAFSVFSSP